MYFDFSFVRNVAEAPSVFVYPSAKTELVKPRDSSLLDSLRLGGDFGHSFLISVGWSTDGNGFQVVRMDSQAHYLLV